MSKGPALHSVAPLVRFGPHHMSNDSPNHPLSHLPQGQLDVISAQFADGVSYEDIGREHGIDFDDVRVYCENFIRTPRSRTERLVEMLEELEESIYRTKQQLDQAGWSNGNLVTAYRGLVAEYRDLLSELDKIKTPEDTVDDIIQKVFNPFVTDLVRVSTEETRKLKGELKKRGIPNRDAIVLAEDTFRRLAERVQNVMPKSVAGLDSYFGVDAKTRKAREASK